MTEGKATITFNRKTWQFEYCYSYDPGSGRRGVNEGHPASFEFDIHRIRSPRTGRPVTHYTLMRLYRLGFDDEAIRQLCVEDWE